MHICNNQDITCEGFVKEWSGLLYVSRIRKGKDEKNTFILLLCYYYIILYREGKGFWNRNERLERNE